MVESSGNIILFSHLKATILIQLKNICKTIRKMMDKKDVEQLCKIVLMIEYFPTHTDLMLFWDRCLTPFNPPASRKNHGAKCEFHNGCQRPTLPCHCCRKLHLHRCQPVLSLSIWLSSSTGDKTLEAQVWSIYIHSRPIPCHFQVFQFYFEVFISSE